MNSRRLAATTASIKTASCSVPTASPSAGANATGSHGGSRSRECVTSSVEHARIILAAIIPNRTDLLDRALRDLTPEQIPDRSLANLFTMLERYSEVTQGSILTRSALD